MTEQKTPERDAPRRRPAASACAFCILAAIAVLSCQQERRAARSSIRGEPAVEATVLTIQTTIQPENKTTVHSLVIADDRARSGDEVDRWRLFDFQQNRITYVDDIAKTYRTVPMATAVAELRQAIDRQPLRPSIPAVTIVKTGAHRVIQGAEASEVQLRVGTYTRQMWIGNHPLIPQKLYSMMLASAPSRSPLVAMMKGADEALMAMDGFPLADHAELAFDTKKLVIDQTVVKIERRNVPQSWLNVSPAYRDITPPPPAPPKEKRSERKRK